MQKMGMEQSKADPCVFRKKVDGEVSLTVCALVGDLVVIVKRTKKRLLDFMLNQQRSFP